MTLSNADLKAPHADLERLHAALARALTKRVKDANATAADLAVAAKFLKDNGIDRPPRVGDPSDPLTKLDDALPFPVEE